MLTSSGDLVHTDPALDYSQTEMQVAALAYDGLAGFRRVGGNAGLQLVPDLAVSLPAPSDGGRSYSFQLRPGIRYSTGALVQPEDFRRAIERSILLSGPGFWFDDVVGARRCLAAPKKPCDLSQGIVTDPAANTVTFHLTAPDPDFLYKLTLPAASAVPAATPLHLHAFAPATGPYEIASFDPKRGIAPRPQPEVPRVVSSRPAVRLPRRDRRARHRHHRRAHHAGGPRIGGCRVRGPELEETVAGCARVRADPAREPARSSTRGTSPGTSPSTREYRRSTTLAARRALNLAVDREHLRDLTVGRGLGSVTCQILPPALTGYSPYCPYTAGSTTNGAWTAPDLARARRLVRSSGTAGEAVTVWLPTMYQQFAGAPGRAVGSYVVSVLDSLGYRARYRSAYDPFLREDKLHLQLGFNGWYPDFGTPSSFINPLLTCRSYDRNNALNNNSAEFCNRRIDREIARARSLQTSDPGAASGLWAKIDRDLTEQAPWVPYANGVALDVVSTRVGNYQVNPQLGTLLDQLWVK